MSEVLSNDQISALVEAAKRGEVATKADDGPKRRPRRVREVDFARPTKFTQEQIRRWERGHEAFCRGTATQLSAELRSPVELEVINVDQQTWIGALGEIPQPSVYGIVETSLGTKVLISIELPTVIRLVERMLGGSGVPKQLDRELSEIELALARRMFATMLSQLSRTWDELLGVTLDLVGLETQQTNIQLAPTTEPTLTVTIECRTDGVSSTISLTVPHRAIAEVTDRLGSSHYGEEHDPDADAAAAAAVRAALADVAVEVRAEVGSVDMTIAEVLALRAGDVVDLATRAEVGGTLFADAVPIQRIRPGRSHNRRAVEVLGPVEPA